MTKKNILAGWAKTSLFPFNLFPFNLSRVLRDNVKPDAPLTIQVSHDTESTQNGVNQTPVTPVSSEAVPQLLSLIKQDSRSYETSMHEGDSKAPCLAENTSRASLSLLALSKLAKRNALASSSRDKLCRQSASLSHMAFVWKTL